MSRKDSTDRYQGSFCLKHDKHRIATKPNVQWLTKGNWISLSYSISIQQHNLNVLDNDMEVVKFKTVLVENTTNIEIAPTMKDRLNKEI